MFLKAEAEVKAGAGLPHVSGGVSILNIALKAGEASSPREWGCFGSGEFLYNGKLVFPT